MIGNLGWVGLFFSQSIEKLLVRKKNRKSLIMPNFEFGVSPTVCLGGSYDTLGKNLGLRKKFSLFKIEVIPTTVSIILVVPTNIFWERASYQIRLKL